MIKQTFAFLWEAIKIIVIALLIVVPIRYFLFQPFIVRGDSMIPNFENNDYLLIDELSFRLRDPQRGEAIVFRPPNNNSSLYIKRVIGLPYETVKVSNGNILIIQNRESFVLDESNYLPKITKTTGNIEVFLGEDEYFVLGDNRDFSSDSRIFGIVSGKSIVGRAFFRAFPLDRIERIKAPVY